MSFFNRWAATVGSIFLILALAEMPAQGQTSETELLGPLRIRDMTPFNILHLDLLPAHACTGGPGTWAVEVDFSRTNTFVMSDNVREYLDQRGSREPLTEDDAAAIRSRGEDFYFFDGEIALLDLTFHYGVTQRTSIYLTLPVYDFTGGWFDGTVEGFHKTFGLGNAGRDLVARDRFQAVASLGGRRVNVLDNKLSGGMGDPVFGLRYAWPVPRSAWTLVLDGAAKLAVQDVDAFRSTGGNDFGLQVSLQRKLRRQGFYLSGSLVRTDGKVLGIPLGNHVVPTLTAVYEVGLTPQTNVVLQLYASESAVRGTSLAEIKANKYEASLGLRSRAGRLLYGVAVTENLGNYQNTPDIGLTLTLGWIGGGGRSPDPRGRGVPVGDR